MTKRISTSQLDALLRNLSRHYKKSLFISNWFGGPSIYFHRECIRECKRNFLSHRHIELIYATLSSWGLHRMGDPKKTAKLTAFSTFKDSIVGQAEDLRRLRMHDLARLNASRLDRLVGTELRTVFSRLDISTSRSKLVANSKTLHHLLPDLVPPIDRKHTLAFFYGSTHVPKGQEGQYQLFSEIMGKMRLLVSRLVRRKEFTQMRILRGQGDFNTSYPKIADNLIMTFIKESE